MSEFYIAKFQDFILSSKAIKIYKEPDFEVKLESKFGYLKFKAPSDNFSISAARIGGNGKIIINGTKYQIRETSAHYLDIDINGSSLESVEISRPNDGLGEISLFEIKWKINEKKNSMLAKWKKFSKNVSYGGLRVVGDQLFASEGAWMDGEKINEAVTDPPNSVVRQDNKIKFIQKCKVIDLSLNESILFNSNSVKNNTPPETIFLPTKHLDPPTLNKKIENINSSNNINNSINILQPQKDNGVLVYSSKISGNLTRALTGQNKLIKKIISNGQEYLCLKKGGVFNLSLPELIPGENYLIALTCKKLNGNGRVSIYLNENSQSKVLVDSNFSQKKVICKANHSNDKLSIGILEDGIGEVLISSIIVNRSFTGEIPKEEITDDIASTHNIKYNRSDKKFVIVIPSYKNSKWCEKNILSTTNQNYKNYRVIFTDDCSPDDTFEKVSAIVNKSINKDKFTLIKNTVRVGALENLYNMIYSCADDEIILTLDGDDWLANNNVLNVLNMHYSMSEVWMTYGQYQNYPDGGIGVASKIPEHIIASNGFRQYKWCASHLRTFYTWLFKMIKKEDLMYEGKFASVTWDAIIEYPALEMSGYRSKYINDILYIYNLENPINDHKVHLELQQKLDHIIRNMPKYSVLKEAPKSKKINIGLLLIATGKYDKFVPGLISSADNYFFNDDKYNVTYYLFADKQNRIKSERNITEIYVEHKPFPAASANRFKHFTENASKLNGEDYLFYVDVDCLFVDNIGDEIIGDLVGVKHCGFYSRPGPYETNKDSAIYVDPSRYKHYFGGGFQGGSKNSYLNLAKWCYNMTEIDSSNGIKMIWDDESAINRYFLDNEPDVILSPSYHFPQKNLQYYKEGWKGQDFKAKILLLDKNHAEIRA